MKDFTQDKPMRSQTFGYERRFISRYGIVQYSIRRGTVRTGAQFQAIEVSHPLLRVNVARKLKALKKDAVNF